MGSRLYGYSEIQKRITAFNGSQCGYCTPGWVMHMHRSDLDLDLHLDLKTISILEVKRRKEKNKYFFTYTWDTLTKKLRIEYLISIMLRCKHPERRFSASYKTPIIVYIILSIIVIISNHSKLLSPSGGLRSPEARGGKAK